MKQHLLNLSFLFILITLNAQTSVEESLQTIENQEQAKAFIKDKHTLNTKIFTFNEEKHKTQLAKTLFKLDKGGVTSEKDEYEKITYKILDKTKHAYYRVSYILLDGNTYSVESIEKLRKTLIAKYKSGIPFNNLANQYSMDNNANKGGDSGWFTTGDMLPEFEENIKNLHELDDIYTFDIPSKNWYYVALQTYAPKEIAEIKVLKIIEPLE